MNEFNQFDFFNYFYLLIKMKSRLQMQVIKSNIKIQSLYLKYSFGANTTTSENLEDAEISHICKRSIYTSVFKTAAHINSCIKSSDLTE